MPRAVHSNVNQYGERDGDAAAMISMSSRAGVGLRMIGKLIRSVSETWPLRLFEVIGSLALRRISNALLMGLAAAARGWTAPIFMEFL